MIVHLYNNGELCIPLKHGSRFFKSYYYDLYPDFKESSFLNIDEWIYDVKWIIVRDPIEHLKSALNTEIMTDDMLDDTEGVIEYLKRHYYKPHFGNHYDCEMHKSLYESGCDFKVIELKKFSNFLASETGLYKPSKKIKDWIPIGKKNKPIYISREEFWYEFCKRYPKQSLELVELALKDKEYYDKLLSEKEYKIDINKSLIKLI